MRHFRHAVDSARLHIRSLWCVSGALLLLNLVLGIALSRTQSQLTIHIPPDLKGGALVRPDEPSNANVYTFATYIFQQLNRWPHDGANDFGEGIFRLAPYLTPSFRESLIQEMEVKGKRGELAGRERGVTEIRGQGFAENRVQRISDDVWLVHVDLELIESVKGLTVKQKRLRYPLRVTRHDVDREANPWGLALDGYEGAGPSELSRDE